MADVLYLRLRDRRVRAAAAVSTMTVSLFYLLAQMAAAGGLVNLLLGVRSGGVQDLTIVVVGLLMIFYVLVGGMRGTTWVQIVKAVILTLGAAVTTLWVSGEDRLRSVRIAQPRGGGQPGRRGGARAWA